MDELTNNNEKTLQKNSVNFTWKDIITFPVIFVLTYILISAFTFDFLEGASSAYKITGAYLGIFSVATAYIVSKRKAFNAGAILPGIVAVVVAVSFILNGIQMHFIVSFLMLIYLSGAYCLNLTSDTKESKKSYHYLFDVFVSEVFIPLKNTFIPAKSLFAFAKRTSKGNRKTLAGIGGVLGGVAFAVPVIAVVLPLLIESDAAFDSVVAKTINNFVNRIILVTQDILDPYYIIFGFIPTAIVAPYIYNVMFCFRHGIKDENGEKRREAAQKLQFVSVNMFAGFLGAVCLVYVIYLFSQTAYFFSAFTGKLPNGMEITVTDYARRGFFEMVIVAVINLLLIGSTVIFSKRNNKNINKMIKAFDIFICIFTMILIITSISKIILYISEMGLTHKRIYVFAIDIVLFVSFFAVLLKLILKKFQYMKLILACVSVAVMMISLTNIDRVISDFNVDMYLSGKHQTVDINALETIGLQALEPLFKLTKCEDKAVRKKAEETVANIFYYEVMDYKKPDGTAETMKPAKRDFVCLNEFFALQYAKENFEELAEIHAKSGWWFTDDESDRIDSIGGNVPQTTEHFSE